jgi:hypothetical protein
MPIPARIHFCWIGPALPWAYVFAVLSAAAQAQMDEVVLHHTDELQDTPGIKALRAAAGVRLEHVDAKLFLEQAGAPLGLGAGLAALYAGLTSPVQRADVLRAAILYVQGGIYLDLDTMTVASLRPLLAAPQFVGTEHIVWPLWVRTSRSPVVWARHLALDVLRKILRLTPGGWRGFRAVEGWYFKGVNNAIMGAEPGAALFAAYLQAMVQLPPAQQTQPYALGPHLLQTLVSGFSAAELTIHEPATFYPLAPEISEHWFRPSRAQLSRVLRPGTRVVHWYASVRAKRHIALIDPAYIRANCQNQLYSALVCKVLPQL